MSTLDFLQKMPQMVSQHALEYVSFQDLFTSCKVSKAWQSTIKQSKLYKEMAKWRSKPTFSHLTAPKVFQEAFIEKCSPQQLRVTAYVNKELHFLKNDEPSYSRSFIFPHTDSYIYALDEDRDGLIALGFDGFLGLHQPAVSDGLTCCMGHQSEVTYVKFFGPYIFSADRNRQAFVWDKKTTEGLYQFSLKDLLLLDVDFLEAKKQFLIIGKQGALFYTLENPSMAITNFSPNTSSGTIQLCYPKAFTFSKFMSPIFSVHFDASTVYISHLDQTISLWNKEDLSKKGVFSPLSSGNFLLHFAATPYVFVLLNEKELIIREKQTGKRLQKIDVDFKKDHLDTNWFNVHGTTILCTCDKGGFVRWDF